MATELYAQLATMAGETGRTIKSVYLFAAGVVHATLITWGAEGTGAEPYRPAEPDVQIMVRSAWPNTLLLRPTWDLDEVHVEAGATAWAMGAYDFCAHWFPARDCLVPHIPWALGDEFVDDVHTHTREAVRLGAQADGMSVWVFLPMAFGPTLRRKAWLTKDRTLADDGTRALTDLPAFGPPLPQSGKSRQHVVTFGRT